MAVSQVDLFRIYNTLTRKVEVLQTIKKNKVSLYTCGPTVYNYAHIGNLRTYIFEDVLERTLARNGYKVRRVMNITDVGHLTSDADQGEDKIEKEAAKEKKTVWEIAKFYTNAFLKDAKKINIKIPRLLVPATKTIPEQIRIIEILASKGLAYETPKAIYFDVSKFKDYTKLSRQPLSEKITAAREEVVSDPGKRNPADFVLWFKLVDHFKHHVMRWRSLWGEGFPGWHIECSAISTKYLGQPFDIHTGGIDHVGVHHTNEIAQSEGAFDRPLANYWMHGEFLTVNQDRMGKSLGNFITLRDLQVKGFDPLAYRYLILTSHYRSRLDFSFESLRAAANGYHSLKNRLLALKNIKINIKGKDARAADDHLGAFDQNFREAMNNDLNTAKALASIHELLNRLNALAAAKSLDRKTAKKAYAMIIATDKVLGLKLATQVKIPKAVASLVAARELSRSNKQFAEADGLRKQIEALGYTIEDTPNGPLVLKKR